MHCTPSGGMVDIVCHNPLLSLSQLLHVFSTMAGSAKDVPLLHKGGSRAVWRERVELLIELSWEVICEPI